MNIMESGPLGVWAAWSLGRLESGALGVWAAWSKSAARVAISGLMNAKLISPADQDRATEIVEEETLVRLCAGDRPDLESWLAAHPN